MAHPVPMRTFSISRHLFPVMTKFVLYGSIFGCISGIAIVGTFLAVCKLNLSYQLPPLEQLSQQTPPSLHIAKTGVTKKIIAAEQEIFSCSVEQSHIELLLNQPKCTIREYLQHISGSMTGTLTQTNKALQFQGSSGVLDFHNASLTLHDCSFDVTTPSSEDHHETDPLAIGKMKTMSLSILP